MDEAVVGTVEHDFGHEFLAPHFRCLDTSFNDVQLLLRQCKIVVSRGLDNGPVLVSGQFSSIAMVPEARGTGCSRPEDKRIDNTRSTKAGSKNVQDVERRQGLLVHDEPTNRVEAAERFHSLVAAAVQGRIPVCGADRVHANLYHIFQAPFLHAGLHLLHEHVAQCVVLLGHQDEVLALQQVDHGY